MQAATQRTQLAGSILGGLLISWTSAPTVLLIDAATYAFSFFVIFVFVRAGKKLAPESRHEGSSPACATS